MMTPSRTYMEVFARRSYPCMAIYCGIHSNPFQAETPPVVYTKPMLSGTSLQSLENKSLFGGPLNSLNKARMLKTTMTCDFKFDHKATYILSPIISTSHWSDTSTTTRFETGKIKRSNHTTTHPEKTYVHIFHACLKIWAHRRRPST